MNTYIDYIFLVSLKSEIKTIKKTLINKNKSEILTVEFETIKNITKCKIITNSFSTNRNFLCDRVYRFSVSQIFAFYNL